MRRCRQATRIKGIDIPENLTIAANVLSLHYDSKYWGDIDPNIFYPERLVYKFKPIISYKTSYNLRIQSCFKLIKI